ncbi:MAG: YceI family protein [Bacteroidota bacterium]|nr:YceI family protein [Bacteroidota bacterium]
MLAKTKWVIDSVKSRINFEIEHFILPNIKGTFKTFDATVYSINNDFTKDEINFLISSGSLNTNDTYCEEHLKSANVFDVENHKQIVFKGRIVEKLNRKGNYVLLGELTIKGITKRIEFAVKFLGLKKSIFGNEKVNFTSTGIINRNDWGLNFNDDLEAWQILVNDKIKINCELQLKRSTIQDLELPFERRLEQKTVENYALPV